MPKFSALKPKECQEMLSEGVAGTSGRYHFKCKG